ncbi:MAG: dihydrofolate reductase family protein [Candidatus Thorarchaeota archaeon]
MVKRTKTKNSTLNKNSKSAKSKSVVIERTYNASVQRVWSALTNNAEIKQWYFDLPEFNAEIGFEFTFLAGKDENNQYRHLCKITDVILNKKLAYSWRYDGYDGNSEVIFELFSEGEKTRVKLTHKGIDSFPKDIADFASENFEEGWTITLGKSLKEYVETNKRKIVMWNLVTLDGYFDGPDGWQLDWHNYVWGEQLEQFSLEQSRSIGVLLFGRLTYEGMAKYWSVQKVEKGDIADFMNSIPKIVVSTTMSKAEWNNTQLIKTNVIEEITKLKNQEGKDIYIFGSANLSSTLMDHNLIDEYRLCIVPVILGEGKSLFKSTKEQVKMKLLETKQLKTGGVILFLEPEVKGKEE